MTETTTDRFVVRHAGEGDQVWLTRNRITMLADSGDTGGAYGLIISEAPRGSSSPLHIHHRSDEAIWVDSGRLRIVCGDRDFILEAGGFTLLPRGVPHTFLALEDVKMLGVISPGGEEAFFAEGGLPVTSDTPPAPDVERMGRAAAHWEAEFVGPPLSLES